MIRSRNLSQFAFYYILTDKRVYNIVATRLPFPLTHAKRATKQSKINKQTIKQAKMIVYKQTHKNDDGGGELKITTFSQFNVYKFLKLSQIVSKQVPRS